LRANDKLIVALDVQNLDDARSLVAALREVVGMFKIGSQLFTNAGPHLVREIVSSGGRVFLDLKFHDIPHQVAGAARAAAQLGVSMFTVHASGGIDMMSRAVEAVSEVAERERLVRPAVVAVSVLTSLDANSLSQIGMKPDPNECVLRLVKLAESSGVDGVVASPQEIRAIRLEVTNPKFLIVSPGIRPAAPNSPLKQDDQKRIATPSTALVAGADYLVVGRPITGAEEPLEAARAIIAEMESA
jgi:orotidine-5'-phosphate decarboxylase